MVPERPLTTSTQGFPVGLVLGVDDDRSVGACEDEVRQQRLQSAAVARRPAQRHARGLGASCPQHGPDPPAHAIRQRLNPRLENPLHVEPPGQTRRLGQSRHPGLVRGPTDGLKPVAEHLRPQACETIVPDRRTRGAPAPSRPPRSGFAHSDRAAAGAWSCCRRPLHPAALRPDGGHRQARTGASNRTPLTVGVSRRCRTHACMRGWSCSSPASPTYSGSARPRVWFHPNATGIRSGPSPRCP